MEYNKGNATAGLLSKQGLLTDLTAVAKERGWTSKISDSASVPARYTAQGEMGGDKWFGVPNYGEFVLAYYDKDMFAKYGVSQPTDMASFEDALAKFKAAGVTPLANAGNDHPASHWLYLLALSKADKKWVQDYQTFSGKIDFHGPEWTYAVETYKRWLDKGYFDKNDVSLKGGDMTEQFVSGKRPILVGGNWWFGSFKNDIKDFAWGTAVFPGSKITLGSSGNLWVVPQRSKNKKLAEDFIDITMSPEIQALIGNGGITDPKSRDLVSQFDQVQKSDGLGYYPDWPAAGYFDVLVSATQNLMNGADTKSVLDQIAAPYEKQAASRR
jgi:raffinose/stachyose/melibiose transport system substrate-binding protein